MYDISTANDTMSPNLVSFIHRGYEKRLMICTFTGGSSEILVSFYTPRLKALFLITIQTLRGK